MRRLIIVVLILCNSAASFGWGNEGHIAINRAAADSLPADFPTFMKQAADRISWLGPEPDRWRSPLEPQLKAAQEPDHFMDMELVRWLQPLPPDRMQFIRALYDRRAADPQHPDTLLPEKVGFQPYITLEIYDRLKVAFREYRHALAAKQPTTNAEQNAIFYAGWLGHYVGDTSNPLHTSIQYNGWVGPNPNGYTTAHDIHWKMEGPFVAANLINMPFAQLMQPERRLKDPWRDYLDYMNKSNQLVERVYQLDKAHGFDGEGTKESRDFIAQRLAVGAQMLRDMIYTAWVESAVDPPPYQPPKPDAAPAATALPKN